MNRTQACPDRGAVWYIAKAIRVITVPPVMAIAAFSIFLLSEGFYSGLWEYFAAVGFIALLPMLAYPLQGVLPPFKNCGREGQRSLAMILSCLGYILGVITALAFGAEKTTLTVFLAYLFSGSSLFVINKAFRFKASGHACGITGPAACLAYFIGSFALVAALLVFALAMWSSVYMKRHSVSQFVVGAAIPVVWLAVWGTILL